MVGDAEGGTLGIGVGIPFTYVGFKVGDTVGRRVGFDVGLFVLAPGL